MDLTFPAMHACGGERERCVWEEGSGSVDLTYTKKTKHNTCIYFEVGREVTLI